MWESGKYFNDQVKITALPVEKDVDNGVDIFGEKKCQKN